MKIPKNCKLEKVASKDKNREAINFVMIDPKEHNGALNQYGNTQAHAIATNGKAMVIVPVDTTPEDKIDGEKLLPVKVLTEARKIGGKAQKESIIGMNGAAMIENGQAYPFRKDLTFPNWRQVMPEGRAKWLKDSKGGWEPEVYKTIRFDAKLLFELSQAIGAVNNQITLQIPVNDPTGPLVIEEKTTGAKGILMPCRNP